MATAIKPPTRAQFVKMGADPETVRALEALFASAGGGTSGTTDLTVVFQQIADAGLVAEFAAAQALQLSGEVAQARDALDSLSLTPPAPTIAEVLELRKAVDAQSMAHATEWNSEIVRLREIVDGLSVAPPIAFTSGSPSVTSVPGSARGIAVGEMAVRTSADVIQYTASAIVVDTAATGAPVMLAGVNISPSKATAGPAANGRDQAGAFAAGDWLFLHVIYNPAGPTVAGLWSKSATAPTLPTGFTHFAMVHPARFAAAGFLEQVAQNRDVQYSNGFGADCLIVSGGTATTNTAVDLSSRVPPQSRLARLLLIYSNTGTAGSDTKVHDVNATTGASLRCYSQVTAGGPFSGNGGLVPTTSVQGVFYANSHASGSIFLYVGGFRW